MEKHLDLVVGYCSHPTCKIRDKAAEGDLPDEKLEFVHLAHTMPSRDGPTCTAPQMHVQCFERYEDSIMKRLKTPSLNKEEKRKSIWDPSRSGKYDMIQSLCVCKCGGRFIPIISGARNQVSTTCVEISPATEKKKKKRGKARNVNVSSLCLDRESDDEELDDEDALQYMYKRIESCNLDQEENAPAVLEDYVDDTSKFPELPFSGGLPSVPRERQSFVRKQMPSITLKETNDFVCLSVEGTRSKEWTGWLMGKGGHRLKNTDARFDTTTRINPSTDMVRIIICKAKSSTTSEQQMKMAEYLQKEIVKVLSR